MGVEVTWKDTGASEIFEQLAALDGLEVTVGLNGENGARKYPDRDVSVADVGLFMEFGTIWIEPRPFLRTTFFDDASTIAAANANAISKVANGKATAMAALADVGDLMATLVKAKIATARQWAAPLADSTIAAKGHSDPLVDTGLLEDSINYAIRKDGTILETGGD